MQLLDRRWPTFIAAAGVLLIIGGPLHPDPKDSLPYDAYTAKMLDGSTWVPAHVLILLGMVAAALGLTGLARSKALTTVGSRAAVVAAIGAYGSVLEMVFHTTAVVDHDSLVAGGSTPVLDTHVLLAFVTAPVLGVSLAVLMVAESRRLGAAWFAVSMLGAVGAVAWSVSAPIVILTEDPAFSPLFKSAIALAVWFIALAVVSSRLRDRAPVSSDNRIEPASVL